MQFDTWKPILSLEPHQERFLSVESGIKMWQKKFFKRYFGSKKNHKLRMFDNGETNGDSILYFNTYDFQLLKNT